MKKILVLLALMSILTTQAWAVDVALTKYDIIALCANYNYQAEIPDPTDPEREKMLPNPEDMQTFAERMILQFVQENTRSHIINKGADTGRENAKAEAEGKAALTTMKAGEKVDLK